MKIAAFLPNWVGDAVMATPALAALRREFPQATVVGVMRPVIEATLRDSALVDTPLLYDPRGKSPEQRGSAVIRRLQRERCDTAILFPNSLRTAWLAWRSGAKRRIGFDRDLRGWLLTDRVTPKPKHTPHPVIDEYLRLVERFGCRDLSRMMTLAVSPQDETAWRAFLDRHPRLQTRRRVAINTGGAFGPAKNWPREKFVELARRLVDERDLAVVVVCGPSERDEARQIASLADRQHVVSLADEPLGIGLTKAVIRGCDLLVTTDSGPRHFATAFDVPTVTLFGPTHIAWSETFHPRAQHIQLKLDCGPCQQRACPLKHHRCMRDLDVERVFAAVCRGLEPAATDTRAA